MLINKWSLLILSIFAITQVQAEIYKSVDSEGKVTYSNIPMKGAKKINLLGLTHIPSTVHEGTHTLPENFPRVDHKIQAQRDESRIQLLAGELKSEQAALLEAQQALEAGQAIRLGNEKNYQKYLDRIQNLKDNVSLHQRNEEEIQKELDLLKNN